jgi:hypothetical protein
MAIFGRESATDLDRAEKVRLFVQSRNPKALISVMFGVLGALDFFTLVIGIPLAITAIVLGVMGLRELKLKPELLGTGLCYTGITLGCLGLLLSMAFLIHLTLRHAA